MKASFLSRDARRCLTRIPISFNLLHLSHRVPLELVVVQLKGYSPARSPNSMRILVSLMRTYSFKLLLLKDRRPESMYVPKSLKLSLQISYVDIATNLFFIIFINYFYFYHVTPYITVVE